MSVEVEEALNFIENNILNVGYEIISIEESFNRISAQDLIATHCMPRFNNSAMDGYGVKLSDANQNSTVLDTILAGSNKQT
ncbi:MAG: molybdopterin molybdenumtransferase MoeA, partial [Epsilonproteobacteria bacterium]